MTAISPSSSVALRPLFAPTSSRGTEPRELQGLSHGHRKLAVGLGGEGVGGPENNAERGTAPHTPAELKRSGAGHKSAVFANDDALGGSLSKKIRRGALSGSGCCGAARRAKRTATPERWFCCFDNKARRLVPLDAYCGIHRELYWSRLRYRTEACAPELRRGSGRMADKRNAVTPFPSFRVPAALCAPKPVPDSLLPHGVDVEGRRRALSGRSHRP